MDLHEIQQAPHGRTRSTTENGPQETCDVSCAEHRTSYNTAPRWHCTMLTSQEYFNNFHNLTFNTVLHSSCTGVPLHTCGMLPHGTRSGSQEPRFPPCLHAVSRPYSGSIHSWTFGLFVHFATHCTCSSLTLCSLWLALALDRTTAIRFCRAFGLFLRYTALSWDLCALVIHPIFSLHILPQHFEASSGRSVDVIRTQHTENEPAECTLQAPWV